MNQKTAPTFHRYYIAWLLGWLTINTAAICATMLVFGWSAIRDGFDFWVAHSVMGFGREDGSTIGALGVVVLICGLICAGLQFLLWFGVDTFAPRETAEKPLTVSTLIGGLVAGLLVLFFYAFSGIANARQWENAGVIGRLLVWLAPFAGAPVVAGYKSAVQRTRVAQWQGYRRLWAMAAGGMVMAIYLAGMETPQYLLPGKWEVSTQCRRDTHLRLDEGTEGYMADLNSSGDTLFAGHISWREQGRNLTVTSVSPNPSGSQVIATGIISKDAKAISLRLVHPPETVTLTRDEES